MPACPLYMMSLPQAAIETRCIQDQCAWWDAYNAQCSVRSIAAALLSMREVR